MFTRRVLFFKTITCFLVLWGGVTNLGAMDASLSPFVEKAKKEAEARGYVFISSHDEIVTRAKTELKLRVLSSHTPDVIRAMTDAFKKKYPFIDLDVQEIPTAEEQFRFLLELKAGGGKKWDSNRLHTDYYREYLPYQKKFDILSMAQRGVLNIPVQMIDPVNRNVVAFGSNISGVAYNKKLVSEKEVPNTWEDFLKPQYKGHKFATDIRPLALALLVPAWGLEKTRDFAQKIAAQQPIWGRGYTRMLASMLAGEYAFVLGPNFPSTMHRQRTDRTGSLGYVLFEPVPMRLTEANGILETAEHPHAAILWLEFQANPEGQKILDEYGPYEASYHSPDSAQSKVTQRKKLSVVDWNHYLKLPEYLAKLTEAYGFPKTQER